jgi:hypothetical protein
MAEDCDKKAADLGFDVTKQFLTLALAGIAFVSGLSFNSPGTVSSVLQWAIMIAFGLSVVFGLVFLMRGVNLLSIEKSFDIYMGSLRILAMAQIVLFVVGVALLFPIINRHSASKSGVSTGNLEVKIDANRSIVYTADPTRTITIELDGGKAKVTATPKVP